jgi:hypothetical protein
LRKPPSTINRRLPDPDPKAVARQVNWGIFNRHIWGVFTR